MVQLVALVGHGQPVNDLAVGGACKVHIHCAQIVRCMAVCMKEKKYSSFHILCKPPATLMQMAMHNTMLANSHSGAPNMLAQALLPRMTLFHIRAASA